jgi:hypothetical protein
MEAEAPRQACARDRDTAVWLVDRHLAEVVRQVQALTAHLGRPEGQVKIT